MIFNNALCNGKAEAGTVVFFTEKWIEDVFEIFGCDAGAGVADKDGKGFRI